MPHGVNAKETQEDDEDGEVDSKMMANKKLLRATADDNFDLDVYIHFNLNIHIYKHVHYHIHANVHNCDHVDIYVYQHQLVNKQFYINVDIDDQR